MYMILGLLCVSRRMLTDQRIELIHEASDAILLAEGNLRNFPYLEYEAQKADMNRFRQLWLTEFEDTYRNTSLSDQEALSLHEMLWLAWAGCYLLQSVTHRRNYSKEEALQLHARVRLMIREWNDFGCEFSSQMKELEFSCAALAFYGPPSDPVPPKPSNQGVQLDDEKRLFLIQVDQNIDFETPYHDHRLAKHKGNLALYAPKRWSQCQFVSDACRLFFWSQQCALVFSRAGIVDRAELDDWQIRQTQQMIDTQAAIMCTTETEQVATLCYYRLNLPLGALHAYNRNVRVTGDAFTAISRDCGNQHIRALTEHLTSHPERVVSSSSSHHPMRDAWIWTLWDRLLRSSQVEWFQEFMCFPETLFRNQLVLSTRHKWRIHRRSPMVIYMLGFYWVQWVHPDSDEFVLWRCQDAVHAIATWCSIMQQHHQGLTMNRSDVNPVLDMILKPRQDEFGIL